MNGKTKIIDKTRQIREKISFKNLENGEWFLYPVEDKIYTYVRIENWLSGDNIINACCIEENRVVSFKPDYKDIPLKNVEISFEREV